MTRQHFYAVFEDNYYYLEASCDYYVNVSDVTWKLKRVFANAIIISNTSNI